MKLLSSLMRALRCIVYIGIAVARPALAAGGHHEVDDAVILDPRQCQVETWADWETGGDRELLHLGPGCRVGPVELTLNIDRTRAPGAPSATVLGPQLKWARSIGERTSVGVVLSASWQDQGPDFVGGVAVVPLTWRADDALLVHINVGRDFRRGEPNPARAGAALEWSPSTAWSFVAERFREGKENLWRAGGRWTIGPSLSIDLSRASGNRESLPASWTLGLTWVLER